MESVNKGGMLVKYGIYEGFVPVSHFGPVSRSAPLDSNSNAGARMPALL